MFTPRGGGGGGGGCGEHSPQSLRNGEDDLDLCLRFAAGRGARLFDASVHCYHSAPMELGVGLRWGVVDDEIGSADAARVERGGISSAEEAEGRRAAWRNRIYVSAAAQMSMSALVGGLGDEREAAAARADAARDAAAAAAEVQRRGAQIDARLAALEEPPDAPPWQLFEDVVCALAKVRGVVFALHLRGALIRA